MARALFARSGCSPVNKTPNCPTSHWMWAPPGGFMERCPSAVCKDLGTRLVCQWSPRQFKGFSLYLTVAQLCP